MIDKNFIKDLSCLETKKKATQLVIDSQHKKIMPRIEEMRVKYRKALDELYYEFGKLNYFEGFSDTGWRKIESLFDCGWHYEVWLTSSPFGSYDEDRYEREIFKVPYDKRGDADLVAEYKERRRKLYLEKKKERELNA